MSNIDLLLSELATLAHQAVTEHRTGVSGQSVRQLVNETHDKAHELKRAFALEAGEIAPPEAA